MKIQRLTVGLIDNLPVRNNNDRKIAGQCKALIDLINSAHLTIANGRTLGDLQGKFTCHHWNGSSCVDYGIMSYSF